MVLPTTIPAYCHDMSEVSNLRLPASTVVASATVGDGLQTWARLAVLRRELEETDPAAAADLEGAIEAAVPAAVAHAERLAAFYTDHAAAINNLLMTARGSSDAGPRRVVDEARRLGDDPAAALADRARRSTVLSARSDGMCDALFNLMIYDWAMCFDGHSVYCGTIWADMYDRWCS